MSLARVLVLLCILVEAGWMAFDGTQALVNGHLITPKAGPHAGQLGPWRHLVQWIGVNPAGTPMQVVFAAYGWAWLVLAVAFAARLPWSWGAMVVAAAGALWFLPVGTILSLIQLVLLVTLRSRLQS